jgi:hypothetical protein
LVDVQTIGVLVTAASVTIAAIYYIFTLRNNQRNIKTTLETRQAQLFQSTYSRFSSKEMMLDFIKLVSWEWRDYDDYMEKYGLNNPEEYAAFWEIANFFEGLGIYLKRGLFEADIIDDFLSGPIRIFWEKMRPIILEHRTRENWPSYFEWVEYLYNEIHPITLSQHPEMKAASQ